MCNNNSAITFSLKLSHPTRIIGFGHVAFKIINCIGGVNADKLVFLYESSQETGKPSVSETDGLTEIKLYFEPDSLVLDKETTANRIVEEINRYDLIASVVSGAEHLVFVTALPSTGGFILSKIAKGMSDSPLSFNTLTTVFLQFPFVFEGKNVNRHAANIWQLIESNVYETKKYRLEGLRESLTIGLKRGNEELAKKIKSYIQGYEAVPFIGIDRHRIDMDGEGVTTLVCFHGCPLHCKWCMNNNCHESPNDYPHYTPQQLYEIVMIDDLYFRSTNGGICFGGGEPLMQLNFISHFYVLCDKRWKITAETSLYVPSAAVYQATKVIDEFIVDIKESNPKIYKDYTGGESRLAWNNLLLLLSLVGSERIQVRVPKIPKYNKKKDIRHTIKRLRELGVTRIDLFEYKINSTNDNHDREKDAPPLLGDPRPCE